MVQYGACLTVATPTRVHTEILNKDWVLLDSCSTVSYVLNEGLLKQVEYCDQGQELRVYSSGVTMNKK